MDEKVMNQLDGELAYAGEATTLSPKMLLLEKLRITPEKELEPMEFLFRLFGKPCFPRRELVAITGKAKSGKTFVTSMLMACSITQKVLAMERNTDCTDNTDPKPLRVLWYDTEQSDESTQDILKNRVLRMIHKTNTSDSNITNEKSTLDLFNSQLIVKTKHINTFNTLRPRFCL